MRKKLKKLFTFLLALVASVGMSWAAPAVAVNGKLPGAFSVGESTVVYFSQGNLQYTKSTGKWKIMDHQYDVVETLSQNVGTDYASQDVITLFGWGTSGWDNTAADATSVHYQPYSTCKTIHNSNANINNYQYGPSNANVVGSSKAASAESWSKSDSYKNYDWGVKNSSDLGSGWRVLTTQEWGYLFNTRTPGSSVNGVSNARYTEATINTDGTAVNGIILFPDDATLTTVSGVTWGTINGTSAWGTTCTTAGWEALEAAGCVFLPAASYRDGTSVYNVRTCGFYWSSSAYSANYAYGLYFYSGSVGPQEINGRYDGCSVRLVSETAPASATSVTAARFVYNYDCQRSPAFPKVNNPCNLSGFKDPYEGYKGYRNGNIALGPWKLEFVDYYTPSKNYDCASQVNDAVHEYYSDLSYEEREAKKLEMPIFRLWQYNLTAQEYQPAAYGIVCAYAGEANAQDHAALFVSSNGMGCFLSGHQHTTSFALTCENDLTTGLAALVDAASAPSDPYYDVVWPVIVSIDAIGTVELSDYCKYFIEGSRAAYNALTDEQKAQVTNYSTLTNAETQWEALAAAAQPYADDVIALINAIPNPVVYTQECKDKIDAAQAAYDALTDGQKMLVTNAETLLQAPIAFISAAPYVNIIFKANGNEKKVENVTLPREFTEAEMTTMLKELYGVEGDYDMYAYSNSNADAVNISGGDWTIYPFMGEVNVNGELSKWDPDYEWFDFSLEISLELPPFGSTPASTDEQVPTNADPVNPSYHYSTFFHSTQNYKLTNDGTQAFIADLSGSDLVLTEIANGTQVIPANTAVILRKTGSAEPVVLTPTEENGVSFSAHNSLEGVDVATPIASIDGLTQDNCYVLSGTDQYGVGFYRILGNQLKAHKAYVIYNGSQSNAPRRMRFVFNQEQVATGIDNANADIKAEKRIENGQLIIIKNGVRYNVQGQVIK